MSQIELSTEIDTSEPEPEERGSPYVLKSILVDPNVWTDARIKAMRTQQSLSGAIRDLLKEWTYNAEPTTSGVGRAD